MSDAGGVICQRCNFLCTGTVNTRHALQSAPSGLFSDCAFSVIENLTNSNNIIVVQVGTGSGEVRTVFDRCLIRTQCGAGATGSVSGLYISSGAAAVLNGCIFRTVAPGAAGGPKDINIVSGTCLECATHYETITGTTVILTKGYVP